MNLTGTSEPGASVSSEERTWGMVAHLSALLGFFTIIGSILAPLVIWLIKKDESTFVGENAREALNFNITVLIAGIACAILVVIGVGVLLALVLGVYWLVMTILAAVKASEGNIYRYGISLRLVK